MAVEGTVTAGNLEPGLLEPGDAVSVTLRVAVSDSFDSSQTILNQAFVRCDGQAPWPSDGRYVRLFDGPETAVSFEEHEADGDQRTRFGNLVSLLWRFAADGSLPELLVPHADLDGAMGHIFAGTPAISPDGTMVAFLNRPHAGGWPRWSEGEVWLAGIGPDAFTETFLVPLTDVDPLVGHSQPRWLPGPTPRLVWLEENVTHGGELDDDSLCGRPVLYDVMDASRTFLLPETITARALAIAPDGGTIAALDADGRTVHIFYSDTNAHVSHVFDARTTGLTVSPDGIEIAVSLEGTCDTAARIVALRQDTLEERLIAIADGTGIHYRDLEWSSVAPELIYAMDVDESCPPQTGTEVDAGPGLWVVRADGSERQRLPVEGLTRLPRWSPRGGTVTWLQDQPDPREPVPVNRDIHALHNLADTTARIDSICQTGMTIKISGTASDLNFDHYTIMAAKGPYSEQFTVPVALNVTTPVISDTLAQWTAPESATWRFRLDAIDKAGNTAQHIKNFSVSPASGTITAAYCTPNLFSPNSDGLLDSTTVHYTTSSGTAWLLDSIVEHTQHREG